MLKKHEDGRQQEFFPITSVSRPDLTARGFDTADVSDATMGRLASKMEDAYCENGFWEDMSIIAEGLGIPKRSKRCYCSDDDMSIPHHH